MKVEYIIDGYNLILGQPGFDYRNRSNGLESARNRLILLLNQFLQFDADQPDSKQINITIVFDASSGSIWFKDLKENNQKQGLVSVVYTSDSETADDWIIRYLNEHTYVKQCKVVSDDREIHIATKRRKAKILSCAQFLRIIERQLDSDRREKSPADSSDVIESNGTEGEDWGSIFKIDDTELQPEDLFEREMKKFSK